MRVERLTFDCACLCVWEAADSAAEGAGQVKVASCEAEGREALTLAPFAHVSFDLDVASLVYVCMRMGCVSSLTEARGGGAQGAVPQVSAPMPGGQLIIASARYSICCLGLQARQ